MQESERTRVVHGHAQALIVDAPEFGDGDDAVLVGARFRPPQPLDVVAGSALALKRHIGERPHRPGISEFSRRLQIGEGLRVIDRNTLSDAVHVTQSVQRRRVLLRRGHLQQTPGFIEIFRNAAAIRIEQREIIGRLQLTKIGCAFVPAQRLHQVLRRLFCVIEVEGQVVHRVGMAAIRGEPVPTSSLCLVALDTEPVAVGHAHQELCRRISRFGRWPNDGQYRRVLALGPGVFEFLPEAIQFGGLRRHLSAGAHRARQHRNRKQERGEPIPDPHNPRPHRPKRPVCIIFAACYGMQGKTHLR